MGGEKPCVGGAIHGQLDRRDIRRLRRQFDGGGGRRRGGLRRWRFFVCAKGGDCQQRCEDEGESETKHGSKVKGMECGSATLGGALPEFNIRSLCRAQP